MNLRTYRTPALEVACEESGPAAGWLRSLLLHGWPDDARTWDPILEALHGSGYRTFVPYLRGFGPTRFRNDVASRTGQLAALGVDAVELCDAIGLERVAIVGHDWGARAAYIATVLAPERISHAAALSVGWGTNDPDQPLSLRMVQNYWYHWFMATERGARRIREEPLAFTRYIWSIWFGKRGFTEAEFATTARSFENPDWAEITLHSYRSRWGHAPLDPAYAATEERLRSIPRISVPTLVIHGAADPVNEPRMSEGKEHLFTGRYERITLPEVGHFPQREDPAGVADAILGFFDNPSG